MGDAENSDRRNHLVTAAAAVAQAVGPWVASSPPCAVQAPSCMRQKRLTVIGAPPQAFDTPARYFSTVISPSAT